MNKEYKQTFSAIRPSDEAVERVMSMTKENKKKNRFVPALALVACLAVLVTGIFAGGSIWKKPNVVDTPQASTPTESSNSNSKIGPGFVMVAYADDTVEDVKIVDDINNLEPSTPFLCEIGAVDIKGESQKEIDELAKEIRESFEHIEGENEQGKVYFCMSTNTDIYDDAIIYKAQCGNFNFDLNDDEVVKKVKEIRVTNENKDYGYIHIQADDVYYNDDLTLKNDGINYDKSVYLANKYVDYAVLSGERYQKCYALAKNFGNIRNYFGVIWEINDGLYKALNENPNFDLTQIKDTITFEVEFKDGTISKSVIDIAFTSDGKMYAVGGSYDFIER